MGKSFGGNKMYWVIAIIALAALGAWGLRVFQGYSAGENVSQTQLKKWIDEGAEVCILDVRSVKEYQSGCIPGAINIGHRDISNRLDELAPYKDRKIVVYCESGIRSRMARKTLNEAGFSKVYRLIGDMAGWRKAGLPTDSGSGQ
ncbi:MAG: rhodanese-like domain-containing protein [Planctomycetota bacterium]|jgi:rhodanese-related sulfurtransferase